jgi:hypothetical protein
VNGFEVGVDEDKPPGRGERISLVAMPVSKDTTFDFKGEFHSVQNVHSVRSVRKAVSGR